MIDQSGRVSPCRDHSAFLCLLRPEMPSRCLPGTRIPNAWTPPPEPDEARASAASSRANRGPPSQAAPSSRNASRDKSPRLVSSTTAIPSPSPHPSQAPIPARSRAERFRRGRDHAGSPASFRWAGFGSVRRGLSQGRLRFFRALGSVRAGCWVRFARAQWVRFARAQWVRFAVDGSHLLASYYGEPWLDFAQRLWHQFLTSLGITF